MGPRVECGGDACSPGYAPPVIGRFGLPAIDAVEPLMRDSRRWLANVKDAGRMVETDHEG